VTVVFYCCCAAVIFGPQRLLAEQPAIATERINATAHQFDGVVGVCFFRSRSAPAFEDLRLQNSVEDYFSVRIQCVRVSDGQSQ
jgi:hypothetical protein